MATKAKGAKKAPDILDHEKKNDWQRLAQHIRENPVLWGAGLLFVLVCLLAGLAYRASTASSIADTTAQFARALGTEDPALRASELEQVAQEGPLTADALYLAGEAAYEAKDYAKAKQLFQRLREEFPQSEFAPNAVEGLGYIAENEGNPDAALAAYQEVIEKWPGSVARRRQEVNIGRVHERKGNAKEAIEAYKFHAQLYPESPFMPEVESALARLEQSNPELFPEEPAPETPAPEAQAPEAPAADAPAPAPEAPAVDAPVAAPEAPAADAPAPAPEAPAQP